MKAYVHLLNVATMTKKKINSLIDRLGKPKSCFTLIKGLDKRAKFV